ncbi:hypothetical protein PHYSODRAFT_248866 [Phytophthora sojae]|uniref:Elicitin n=1 Tax=Phytophthora sojae (strain P6497) TaxID=1094619 RepID=G4YL88_PHYSP|nr:hypothetical protein PHYSODRAFT_248866 [Phytophthora sojae]EGZ30003.1 hypothetical protein PHYSODRAFT_248866 [Phytophthora sojae]|eukprot:XP_009517278.1 hypothetical protein PHYSODRAFT_248866 [Phytophthora sojae]
MRCWTFGAALAMMVFGAADALENCDSNVLVNAYAGLNVNSQLVTCMTQNNFSAALDGSVDLTTVNAASAPDQVKAICASDSCKTILSTLVGSANFNLTNCIVGNNIVLMTEISNLQATCTALASTTAPAATTAAPTTAPAATTAAPTPAPVATTAAPTPAPVATTAAPTPAPVATTAAPTPAPVATTAAPTPAPVATTAAPAATTAAPTPAPVATTAAPTAAPVATPAPTPAPVATTAAPVATTAAPVATTAAPVATTAAPVATTAAPVATTAAPSDDNTQQQQTFSTLNSDSGSAGGVSPGKYCEH